MRHGLGMQELPEAVSFLITASPHPRIPAHGTAPFFGSMRTVHSPLLKSFT
jgi:hypothetical protein